MPGETGASRIDAYKVLQVDPEADPEVIQAAYRRLAQKYHPDRAQDQESATRMVAINAAWALVRDPATRAEYDRSRAGSPPDPFATANGGGDVPAASRAAPESQSGDWSSGRSSVGSAYDPGTMRKADGYGAAGPPPNQPSGVVLPFGRFAGWSLRQVAARDIDYVEWLERMPIGRPYRDEIDVILRQLGRRRSASRDVPGRHGLFRKR
jgi:curved DNA-binding protein CbpA